MPPPRSMEGTLLTYDAHGHYAFVSGCRDWSRLTTLVVFVGGLTDALLSKDYIPLLAARLPPTAAFAQPELTSARFGYGLSSLDKDVDELSDFISLIASLRAEAGNPVVSGERWVHLIGHSTGCQDCIRFLARSPHASAVASVALQGPVSDREFLSRYFSAAPPSTGLLRHPPTTTTTTTTPATLPSSALDVASAAAVSAPASAPADPRLWPCNGNASLYAFLQHALALDTSGRGDTRMPASADDNAAITARRFASFAGYGGDDDMFSTDFTAGEHAQKLDPLAKAAGISNRSKGLACESKDGVRVLVLLSLADEYLATPLPSRAIARQFAAALGVPTVTTTTTTDAADEGGAGGVSVCPLPLRPSPRQGEDPTLLDEAANLIVFARAPAGAPAGGAGGVVVAGVTGADHACSSAAASATAADALFRHIANEL